MIDEALIRRQLEETVLERAQHETLDQVSATRSSWAVESAMQDEYHGRFVIELLQNARDAWIKANPGRSDGVLRLRLTSDPALIVCNEGVPLGSKVLLYAIGRFGEGDKTHGESIGHKGIGFKSVLEVSRCPEIYSCRDGGGFGLRVGFDPDRGSSPARVSPAQSRSLHRRSSDSTSSRMAFSTSEPSRGRGSSGSASTGLRPFSTPLRRAGGV
jgi:hypothetical protein